MTSVPGGGGSKRARLEKAIQANCRFSFGHKQLRTSIALIQTQRVRHP
jgi:hypothetical protein